MRFSPALGAVLPTSPVLRTGGLSEVPSGCANRGDLAVNQMGGSGDPRIANVRSYLCGFYAMRFRLKPELQTTAIDDRGPAQDTPVRYLNSALHI